MAVINHERDAGVPDFRAVKPSDRAALVDLMRRNRAFFAGSRRDVVYNAIIDDSLGPDRRIATAVVEVDGELVGFVSAVISGSRRYWVSVIYRHPRAAAVLFGHRLGQLLRRVKTRRRNRIAYRSDSVLTPEVDLPPAVAARVGNRLPEGGSPNPSERGSGISLVLYMLIDSSMRGRGLSIRLYRRLFADLKEAGAERCDFSFSAQDPAAIRLYCNFPCRIYRVPGGYWATLRLADLDA